MVDTVSVDIVQHLVYLLDLALHLLDQGPEELNQLWVIEVDAEVEAVEQRHREVLDKF